MLDTSTLLASIFSNIWPIFLLIIVILFFKSSLVKGKIGENIVNLTNAATLDETIYSPLKNVTLTLSDGSSTQIDHIIVSPYGIFVIETKNMSGWIFGDEQQKEWTQQLFKHKFRFQNPLHQNYRHIKALEEVSGLPASAFVSVITFVGDCKFKTPMPSNVFRGISYTRYIRSFSQEKLDPVQIRQVLNKLQNKRHEQSFQTDRNHVNNLKERFEKAPNTCPKCGGSMILRQNRANGNAFYGCSNYPKCRHTQAF